MSSNTACERLYALVATFARLCEIVSSCVCCASSPVLAIQSDRIIAVYSCVRCASVAPGRPKPLIAPSGGSEPWRAWGLFHLIAAAEQLRRPLVIGFGVAH